MIKFDVFDIISCYVFCHDMIYVWIRLCRMPCVHNIKVSGPMLFFVHLFIILTLGRLVTSIQSCSKWSCRDCKTAYREWTYCRLSVQCKYNNKYCNTWVMMYVWFAWIWWLFSHYYFDTNYNYLYCSYHIMINILHKTTYVSIFWRDLYPWDDTVGAYLLLSYLGSLIHFRLYYFSQSHWIAFHSNIRLDVITQLFGQIWCIWYYIVWCISISYDIGCHMYIILKRLFDHYS